jgi:hypothetical protein
MASMTSRSDEARLASRISGTGPFIGTDRHCKTHEVILEVDAGSGTGTDYGEEMENRAHVPGF